MDLGFMDLGFVDLGFGDLGFGGFGVVTWDDLKTSFTSAEEDLPSSRLNPKP